MGLFDSVKKAAQTASQTAQNALNSFSNNNSAQPQSDVVPNATQAPVSQPVVQQVPATQSNEIKQQEVPNNSNSFLGKSFGAAWPNQPIVFNDDHMLYGGQPYNYADLGDISVHALPTVITNGVGQTIYKPTAKPLTLSFTSSQKDEFLKAVDFANQKIRVANGGAIDSRKYNLICTDGATVEVYECYLAIKRKGKGVTGVMGQGGKTEFIMLDKITNVAATANNQVIFQYNDNNGAQAQSFVVVNPESADVVNQIASYVQNYKAPEVSVEDEIVQSAIGETREFSLMSQILTISAETDTFNTYRKEFMYKAVDYSSQLKTDYSKMVHDFDSFMYFYPNIYMNYLRKLAKNVVNLLISSGIWTETEDSFIEKHMNEYHLAIDDYEAMFSSMNSTVQKNKQQMNSLTSLAPNLVGGGFGLSGALKGAAKATAYNLVRDAAASNAVNSMSISDTQKAELYGRIKLENLFNRAFLDYWRVFLTLGKVLQENGKAWWAPSAESIQKGNNVLQNISNPNFPKDQLPIVLIQLLKENPYNRKYYELLDNADDNKDEVIALREYFAYTEKTPVEVQ